MVRNTIQFPDPRKPLSEKQKKFCEEYLVDFIGEKAAIRAGYSVKTARMQASRLLTYANIVDYLAVLRKAQIERTNISADRVLKEIAAIAFSSIGDIISVDACGVIRVKTIESLPEHALRSISAIKQRKRVLAANEDDSKGMVLGVETEIRLWDKTKALEMLGKYLGILEKAVEQGAELPKLIAFPTKIEAV